MNLVEFWWVGVWASWNRDPDLMALSQQFSARHLGQKSEVSWCQHVMHCLMAVVAVSATGVRPYYCAFEFILARPAASPQRNTR